MKRATSDKKGDRPADAAFTATWASWLDRDALAWGLLRHNAAYRREWAHAMRWVRRHGNGIPGRSRERTVRARRCLTSCQFWGKSRSVYSQPWILWATAGPRGFASLRRLARRWKVHRLEDPGVEQPEAPVFLPEVAPDSVPDFELGPILVPGSPAPIPQNQLEGTLVPQHTWPDSVPFDGVALPASGGDALRSWLPLWIRLDRSDEDVTAAVLEALHAERKRRAITVPLGRRFEYGFVAEILALVRRRDDWDEIARKLKDLSLAQWNDLDEAVRSANVRAAKRRVKQFQRLAAERWWEPMTRAR